MSGEANTAVVRRLFDEVVNARHYGLLDELLAPDVVVHSAVLGEVRGADAYKQSVLALLEPCPDFRATVEDVFPGEGDRVVCRLTYRGTDTGGFVRGHAATGKPFEFSAIYVWRLADGRLSELWQEADRVRLMSQLGLLG
jgi:steroid delta-isomerase-like uncharacterized protein